MVEHGTLQNFALRVIISVWTCGENGEYMVYNNYCITQCSVIYRAAAQCWCESSWLSSGLLCSCMCVCVILLYVVDVLKLQTP